MRLGLVFCPQRRSAGRSEPLRGVCPPNPTLGMPPRAENGSRRSRERMRAGQAHRTPPMTNWTQAPGSGRIALRGSHCPIPPGRSLCEAMASASGGRHPSCGLKIQHLPPALRSGLGCPLPIRSSRFSAKSRPFDKRFGVCFSRGVFLSSCFFLFLARARNVFNGLQRANTRFLRFSARFLRFSARFLRFYPQANWTQSPT